MKSIITLTATIALAITFTLTACEEKGGGGGKLLETITDESGTLKFEYDKQNRIVKIGDKAITYSDNLITVGTEKYAINGNTITVDGKSFTINGDGYIVDEDFEYKDGNLIGTGYASYSYDNKKSLFSGCTSPKWLIQLLLGNVLPDNYAFASKNNVVRVVADSEEGGGESTYKYEYDSDGFPVKVTYGENLTTRFTYRGEPQTAAAKTETTAPQAADTKPAETAGGSTFTDTRDNKTYKTVVIGEQVWMAENLNYEAKGSKCNGELERVYDEASEDYIYKPSNSVAKIQANCQKYGRLYDWKTAMKACPSGWHLPSNMEWEKLLHYVDGTSGTESPYHSKTAGKYLKAKSGWIDDARGQSGSVNGIDNYGFAALPGGNIGAENGNSEEVGHYGLWWSSSDAKDIGMSDFAYYKITYYYSEGVSYSYTDNSASLSVRCIKD